MSTFCLFQFFLEQDKKYSLSIPKEKPNSLHIGPTLQQGTMFCTYVNSLSDNAFTQFTSFLATVCSLCPHPSPSDYDLYTVKSTLPGDVFAQIRAFLANRFLRRRFTENTNKFSIIQNYLLFKKNVDLPWKKLTSLLPNNINVIEFIKPLK